MIKRFLDCVASDFTAMDKVDLIKSIAACEGRVLVSESIVNKEPVITDCSNPELSAAMGADILLLNYLDLDDPDIMGLPEHDPMDTVRLIKRLTGRPVGMNLEPGDLLPEDERDWHSVTVGRYANAVNAKKAADMGISFILITGNPGNGVSNERVVQAIREVSEAVGDRVVIGAGRMHASGVLSESADAILAVEDVREYIQAGADVVLMPAPGTIPGVTLDWVRDRVSAVHRMGKLAMTSIGTSQEGADVQTIRSIALLAKQAGTDIHHIGDTGFIGIALPENIMAYSIAIRGIQHTYRRMALSPCR